MVFGYALSAGDVELGDVVVAVSLSTKELPSCPVEAGLVLSVEAVEVGIVVVAATVSVSAPLVLTAELELDCTVCTVSLSIVVEDLFDSESTGSVVFVAVVVSAFVLVVFFSTADVVLLLLSFPAPPLFGSPIDDPSPSFPPLLP